MEKLMGLIILLFVLLAFGYAGRMDELDSSNYEVIRTEIMESASTWAVKQ